MIYFCVMMMLFVVLLVVVGGVLAVFSDIVCCEIVVLIGVLDGLFCCFQCNGSWYDVVEVCVYLQCKYDYLFRKDKVDIVEQFIEWVVSQSSMSGKFYWIVCLGQFEQIVVVWFGVCLKVLCGC